MTKYQIKPKRDFGKGPGHWLPNAGPHGTGRYGFVKHGYVVTDGSCNVMPGATWFRTVEDANRAIFILEASNGNSDKFWELIRKAA